MRRDCQAPHLVDEWQEVPAVWDAVRRQVDLSGNTRGQLLLTGSSGLSKKKRGQVVHSDTKVDEAVKALHRLRAKATLNPAARNAEPAFLVVIVGRGHMAYTRPDGIHVIPVAALTA